MGTITILDETTKYPITLMGQRAGVCWGANTEDENKNYKRGINCIRSGHGRVMEYVNVEMILNGYSARVIREWYTHLGGSPTRLQASTRYIDYSDFKVVCPASIKNCKDKMALDAYYDAVNTTRSTLMTLEACGVPREDAAMLLPIGMATTVVDKRNLRNLIDMSHQRMCTRAYWEYRVLFNDICCALSSYSDEWRYLVDNYFNPKCEEYGYCTEEKSCGRKPKKEN